MYFVKIVCVIVLLMMCVLIFSQVWMYEYFGVGPQLLKGADNMYPSFHRWLPKYRLSTPLKVF